MTMTDWARHEVELACKKEAPDRNEGEWDYGCACYESALKAYESMLNDNHSGFSWGLTKNILIRLMNRLPLTPIEDVPESWEKLSWLEKNTFQCKRKGSLFKRIMEDGTVEYSDNDRVVVVDGETDTTWHNGFISRLINEMFPITFPYWPEAKPYTVHVREYLTDRKNGDFDTMAVMRVVKPDGKAVNIGRYFGETDDGWKELSSDEFNIRYRKHLERVLKEAHGGV